MASRIVKTSLIATSTGPVALHGRQQRQRHGQDDGDHGRIGDEPECRRQALQDERRNRPAMHDRASQAAREDVAEKQQVLPPQRQVEPEPLLHQRDLFRPTARAQE
jgi:hypothetical protein